MLLKNKMCKGHEREEGEIERVRQIKRVKVSNFMRNTLNSGNFNIALIRIVAGHLFFFET